jgi:hypothetical protein
VGGKTVATNVPIASVDGGQFPTFHEDPPFLYPGGQPSTFAIGKSFPNTGGQPNIGVCLSFPGGQYLGGHIHLNLGGSSYRVVE